MKKTESHYRQCCMDLAYDLGAEITREGCAAVIDFGTESSKGVLARPSNLSRFWEETWFALQAIREDMKATA